MMSAASVLVCVLEVLGRSRESLPPVRLIDRPPLEASPGVEAFVRPNDAAIYLLTSSEVFRDARDSHCTSQDALRKLASVIVHEEWHVRHGPDEAGAYEAQLAALVRLGVVPGSAVHYGVVRAMRSIVARQAGRTEALLAYNRSP